MRRINSKLIVCALLAGAMASMSAVSAGAADYSGATAYVSTPISTPSTNTTDDTKTDDTNTGEQNQDTEETVNEDTGSEGDVGADTEEEEAAVEIEVTGDTITEDVVNDAIAAAEDGEVTLVMSGEEATLTETAIGAIAESDVVVTVETSDGIKITIDPASITEVKPINLAMSVEETSEPQTIGETEVPAGAIVIEPAQKGEFGMELTITLPAETVENLDADNIYLFYINDEGEIFDYSDAIVVNDDGSVSLTIEHASQYVITDEDLIGDAEDEDEFDEDEDEEADEEFDEDEEDADEDEDEEYDEDEDEDEDEDAEDASEEEDFADIEETDEQPGPAPVKPDDKGDKGSKDNDKAPSAEDTGAVIISTDADNNPGTGTGIVFGTFAVTAASAIALAVTSKKRK